MMCCWHLVQCLVILKKICAVSSVKFRVAKNLVLFLSFESSRNLLLAQQFWEQQDSALFLWSSKRSKKFAFGSGVLRTIEIFSWLWNSESIRNLLLALKLWEWYKSGLSCVKICCILSAGTKWSAVDQPAPHFGAFEIRWQGHESAPVTWRHIPCSDA